MFSNEAMRSKHSTLRNMERNHLSHGGSGHRRGRDDAASPQRPTIANQGASHAHAQANMYPSLSDRGVTHSSRHMHRLPSCEILHYNTLIATSPWPSTQLVQAGNKPREAEGGFTRAAARSTANSGCCYKGSVRMAVRKTQTRGSKPRPGGASTLCFLAHSTGSSAYIDARRRSRQEPPRPLTRPSPF